MGGDWLGDQPTSDLPRAAPTRPLTAREMEVLRCLPTRLSTADIAIMLLISPNTVKTHLNHIYRKLQARTRNDAIFKAVRLGLIPSDSVQVWGEVRAGSRLGDEATFRWGHA